MSVIRRQRSAAARHVLAVSVLVFLGTMWAGRIALAQTAHGPEVARQLGVTPLSLTLAGATLADAQRVLVNISGASSQESNYLVARAALDSATQRAQEAARTFANSGDPEALTSYDAAQTDLAAAEASLAIASQAFLAACFEGTQAVDQELLRTIQANYVLGITGEFSVVEWPEAEVLPLRQAIAVEKAIGGRRAVPQRFQDTLQAARANAQVAQAAARLTVDLPLIDALWADRP